MPSDNARPPAHRAAAMGDAVASRVDSALSRALCVTVVAGAPGAVLLSQLRDVRSPTPPSAASRAAR